jgi:glycosyltransferase A (GT-A) superfamily protein (DUF2064 family)
MDTPQVSAHDLQEVAAASVEGTAVLGPAVDGGWWVLALRDPVAAAGLAGVPMSTPDTYGSTRAALERAGLRVRSARTLRDVDTAADAAAVAGSVAGGGGHFHRAWREVAR